MLVKSVDREDVFLVTKIVALLIWAMLVLFTLTHAENGCNGSTCTNNQDSQSQK